MRHRLAAGVVDYTGFTSSISTSHFCLSPLPQEANLFTMQVFVDKRVKSPQYLESEMLRTQNVGMHLQYGP